jgi:hypothetical protein
MARRTTTVTEPPPPTESVIAPDGKELLEPVKVRCHITRLPSGRWNVETSHGIGSTAAIIDHFTNPAHRKAAAGYHSYNIWDVLLALCPGTIPVVAWQEAIVNEYISRAQPQRTIATETTIMADATYLASGGIIYKLQPVEVTSLNKALRVMRRRIEDKTKAEVERIIAAANTSAVGITAEANKRLVEAKAVLDKAKVLVPPPQWAMERSIPLHYCIFDSKGQWSVRFQFSFAITHWDYKWTARRENKKHQIEEYTILKTWNAVPAQAFSVQAWCPILDDKGTYNPRSIYTDGVDIHKILPHMNTGGSCMGLQSGPKFIKGQADLNELAAAISHCFRGVELNSLWTAPHNWHPDIFAFAPPSITPVIKDENYSLLAHPEYKADSQREIDPNDDAKETWVAD